MQASSVILFRVSLLNRFIIYKDILQITNMGSTSSMQILLRGGYCPVSPLVAGLLTFQLFQNCFLRISVGFLVFFLMFGAVIPL